MASLRRFSARLILSKETSIKTLRRSMVTYRDSWLQSSRAHLPNNFKRHTTSSGGVVPQMCAQCTMRPSTGTKLITPSVFHRRKALLKLAINRTLRDKAPTWTRTNNFLPGYVLRPRTWTGVKRGSHENYMVGSDRRLSRPSTRPSLRECRCSTRLP